MLSTAEESGCPGDWFRMEHTVLRWASESLVEDKAAKLMRVGLKRSEMVPWSLEDTVRVVGDADEVIERLVKAKREMATMK